VSPATSFVSVSQSSPAVFPTFSPIPLQEYSGWAGGTKSSPAPLPQPPLSQVPGWDKCPGGAKNKGQWNEAGWVDWYLEKNRDGTLKNLDAIKENYAHANFCFWTTDVALPQWGSPIPADMLAANNSFPPQDDTKWPSQWRK